MAASRFHPRFCSRCRPLRRLPAPPSRRPGLSLCLTLEPRQRISKPPASKSAESEVCSPSATQRPINDLLPPTALTAKGLISLRLEKTERRYRRLEPVRARFGAALLR